ncbi:MAG: N-acetyltransferase [Spirochaetes bacterium]|jgi:hypothetical protein|nr:N-acetyltransferase [Spirochaetota bacterium]
MKNKIEHDRKNCRFYTVIDGHEAYINYSRAGENRIDAFKTYVPDELRGRGVAADLAEALMSFAENECLLITPTCSYVKKYIENRNKK